MLRGMWSAARSAATEAADCCWLYRDAQCSPCAEPRPGVPGPPPVPSTLCCVYARQTWCVRWNGFCRLLKSGDVVAEPAALAGC